MVQKYKKEEPKKFKDLGGVRLSIKLGDEDDPGPTMPGPEGPFRPDTARKEDVISISRAEYDELCRKAGM